MKKYSFILPLLGAFGLASCEKDLHQDLENAEVSVLTGQQVKYEGNILTVRKGVPVTFRLSGNPNFITFFSGEVAHQYKYHGRTEIDVNDIASCNLAFTLAVPNAGMTASCKDQLDILYQAEEIDAETGEVITPAFPGLSKTDFEADSILVESGTAWKTLVPRDKLPQDKGKTVTCSVPLKEFLGRKLTLAIALNKGRKEVMQTDPDNPDKQITTVQSQFTFTSMRIETTWKDGRVTDSYAAAFGFTPLNMDWHRRYKDQIKSGANGYGSTSTGMPGLWSLSSAGTGNMTIGATGRGDKWKCTWLISDYLKLNEGRGIDQGVLVKEISQDTDSYTYTYEKVGTYTATFLMSNVNYDYDQSKIQEFVINVTE